MARQSESPGSNFMVDVGGLCECPEEGGGYSGWRRVGLWSGGESDVGVLG